LTKTVISSKARNLIILKIQALKISPYGRNDKKRGFRSGTSYNMWNLQISPSGQNDNTGGSNEKYGIFVQALYY
ncbi:MAG: hypothetical protein DRP37_04800, partial [Thermodesulfobacteriota bacterium]